MDNRIQRFGVSIEPELLKKFDALIEHKGYSNRSEAIRDLIRDYLVEAAWQNTKGLAVGTVTLVYNHHQHELADKLTELQHHYHDQIISVLHVHLDAHNCLEVLVVKGLRESILEIADRLGSIKGVKHCKFVITTTGEDL